ncbi:MAG TPA: lipoate--protein ligase family protein [Gemmatales bacterium]|nr:lipoate--protein ligase family protein [Gemmatales bacterium]HMP61242.1 lipoate--protein ligase family protein [Gemmatales bacterium]
MHFLPLTLATIAADLALDETLLQAAEAGTIGEVLRVWERPEPAIVLGAAGRLDADVDRDRATAQGLELARRCSGGGTVVLGPGCLCFSLILRLDRHPDLGSVVGANRWIMTQVARQVSTPAMTVDFRGSSDLAVGERKVGGSAQRRARRYLLHHGTLLLELDLELLASLREPTRRPDYRGDRLHLDFVTQLAMPASEVAQRLRAGWGATEPLPAEAVPLTAAQGLVESKYATREWVERL